MKVFIAVAALALIGGCAGQPEPMSAEQKAYWDAVNGVPGARTGEVDYYFTHRRGIFSTGFSPLRR